MWYIDAMVVKGLATLAVLLALASAPPPLSAQTTSHSSSAQPYPPAAQATIHSSPAQQYPPAAQATSHTGSAQPYPPAQMPQSRSDCNGVPCEEQQPRVIVVPPAPTPIQWPWHERILWAAYVVLALVGYAGVMLAVSTLKKIERNTAAAADTANVAVAAANAATDTAQAALLHAQSIINAERPWILVTAEPTRGVESSFEITATNRGRSPATITSALDQVLFAADEAHLPVRPEFREVESSARFVPITLLPGESATLKTFSREDARGFCESDEKFKSIESWDERLFLVGKVLYNDLVAPAGKEAHETSWCCWYIHGKQRSALVPAGPPEYKAHT
jgi:hypothetical protein